MDITLKMSVIPRLLGVAENPQLGMWLLYIVVFALCATVYNLGFAKKLPLLKNVVIYSILALFCTFLTFLAVLLPIAEGLLVIMSVLLIYKIRLRRESSSQT